MNLADTAQQLLARGTAGAVNWRPSADAATFLVVFDRASLASRAVWDKNAKVWLYELSLRNDEARTVTTLTAAPADEHYELLRTLYASARRSALNIAEAEASVEEALEGEGPVGLPRGETFTF